MSSRSDTREAWLGRAVRALRPRFLKAGCPIPEKVRVSLGFTSSGSRPKGYLGECWNEEASADGHFEIFLRADVDEPARALGILAHELAHAAAPRGAKHGPEFKRVALAVGLEGRMTQALPGPALAAFLKGVVENLGPLPHARLDFTKGAEDKRPKQKAYLLKAECAECGYTVRVTAKWVDEVGAPCCPLHGEMGVDRGEEDEE